MIQLFKINPTEESTKFVLPKVTDFVYEFNRLDNIGKTISVLQDYEQIINNLKIKYDNLYEDMKQLQIEMIEIQKQNVKLLIENKKHDTSN